MSGSPSPRRATPAAPDHPDPLGEALPLPQYSLPVVLTAFAAGLFLGTRTGRHLTRGVVHASLLAVKPALLVGGLLKLSQLSHSPPAPPSTQSLP